MSELTDEQQPKKSAVRKPYKLLLPIQQGGVDKDAGEEVLLKDAQAKNLKASGHIKPC